MKMRSYQRRNALLSPAALTSGAGILAIAILFLLLRLVAPGALTAIASPFWRVGTFFGDEIHTVSESFGNAVTVGKERDALQSENASLRIQNAALAAKAQDLTALLGGRANARKGILASVIARPPFAAYDTLVIDEGSDKGIAAGSIVSADAGVPIGTVASVTGASARVVLYSAPGVETPGWIGDKRIPITLTGQGGGTFSLTISKDTGLAVGALAYIAGNGAAPIASIARLDSDPSSAFADVQLKPLINPFSILWVSVSSAAP